MRFYRKLSLHTKKRIFTITFFYAKKQWCSGITSTTVDQDNRFVFNFNGEIIHYILWDLEGCDLYECEHELKRIQDLYKLKTIWILADNNPNSFRALCFSQVPLKGYIKILCDTKYIDYNFIVYTVKRKYSIIRLDTKIGRRGQKIVSILHNIDNEIPQKFQSVIYETSYDSKTSSKEIDIEL